MIGVRCNCFLPWIPNVLCRPMCLHLAHKVCKWAVRRLFTSMTYEKSYRACARLATRCVAEPARIVFSKHVGSHIRFASEQSEGFSLVWLTRKVIFRHANMRCYALNCGIESEVSYVAWPQRRLPVCFLHSTFYETLSAFVYVLLDPDVSTHKRECVRVWTTRDMKAEPQGTWKRRRNQQAKEPH